MRYPEFIGVNTAALSKLQSYKNKDPFYTERFLYGVAQNHVIEKNLSVNKLP